MKDESGRALSSEIIGYLDHFYAVLDGVELDVNDREYCNDEYLCIGTKVCSHLLTCAVNVCNLEVAK